jgi:hypothetical protein
VWFLGRRDRGHPPWESCRWLRALVGAVTGANLEGYILLITLALVVQAALTVLILPRIDRRIARRA